VEVTQVNDTTIRTKAFFSHSAWQGNDLSSSYASLTQRFLDRDRLKFNEWNVLFDVLLFYCVRMKATQWTNEKGFSWGS